MFHGRIGPCILFQFGYVDTKSTYYKQTGNNPKICYILPLSF